MKGFTIFAGIVGFFALVFVISLFFPHVYRIEKRTIIEKPLPLTFSYLNNIHNLNDWSPWNKGLDSTFRTFYSVIKSGTGATQYFSGDLIGKGRYRILESVPMKKIRNGVYLMREDATMGAEATFYFNAHGNNTELSWVDSGDVGYNPLLRFMLPSKIHATEESFEQGLKAIKLAAESKL